jgi:hypothetical protein
VLRLKHWRNTSWNSNGFSGTLENKILREVVKVAEKKN